MGGRRLNRRVLAALGAVTYLAAIACGSFGATPPAEDGGVGAGADAGIDTGIEAASPQALCPGRAGPMGVRVVMGSRSFCVDPTEVTCEQEAAFLEAVRFAGPPPLPQGCADASVEPFMAKCSAASPTVPVGYLTWCGAWAYCAWAGKRLCTVAEWQRACSGGDPNRHFPYGASFDPTACNSGGKTPTAVGSFPGCTTPEGIADLSGNSREWLECPGSGTKDLCILTSAADDKMAEQLECTATRAFERGDIGAGRYDWGVRCCAD